MWQPPELAPRPKTAGFTDLDDAAKPWVLNLGGA